MRTRSRVLGIAFLLAVCFSAVAGATVPTRSQIAGTWSGRYSGAFTGTFTLHWTLSGSQLIGTIKLSRPSGRYGISGTVSGTGIKFGVVGVGAKYTGSVSGSSMSGRYTTPQGGGSWSATKKT